MENYTDNKVPYPVLKICQYPLPRPKIEKLAKECEEILVIEEGYPIIEEQLKRISRNRCESKRQTRRKYCQRDGELNPRLVAISLGIKDPEAREIPAVVASRPPSLCAGCPHVDTVLEFNDVMKITPKAGCFRISDVTL